MYCRLDYFFFFYWYGDHRDLHGLTHSFPTRRSSDLAARSSCGEAGGRREMSGMRIVILGLSLSSSWGNGHATTWRALIRGLAARGPHVTFLERDQPWYADHRDLAEPDYCQLFINYSLEGHIPFAEDNPADDPDIVATSN